MAKLSAERCTGHHWIVRGEAEEGFRSWDQLSPAEQHDVLWSDYPMAAAGMLLVVKDLIPTLFYCRNEPAQALEPYLGYFHDYSGTFCALVMLRSSLATAAKHLASGRMDRLRDALVESAYWARQFRERRDVARQHHGYVAPLPDIDDKILRAKGCR